jgi:Flp pilus assembly protein TadG
MASCQASNLIMNTRIPVTPRRLKQSGSTILELAIVFPMLTLLLFGTVGLGVMLGRFIVAEQICRDVAHMYSDGVDFSQTNNQNIVIQQLASATGMTATGGNGIIILSQIQTVYAADCTAASQTCTNQGLPVFVQRLYIGKQSLKASNFGTPAAADMDAQGNIAASIYMPNTDPGVKTTNFIGQLDDAITRAGGSAPGAAPTCGAVSASTPCAQAQDNPAYVTEVYFTYPDIGFLGWSTAGGAYVRFIFQ